MIPARNLRMAVILPHTKIFGGVKRFFEIGNILIRKGHQFMVITPDGIAPAWFEFKGAVIKLETIYKFEFDVLFITEPDFLSHLRQANTNLRIFYALLERPYIRQISRQRDLIIFANSTKLFHYLGGGPGGNIFKSIGGIDINKFAFQHRKEKSKDAPFIILVYGRFYRKKKGTLLVVKACENLYRKGYNLKLLLFDSPVDEISRQKVERFSCQMPFEFFVDYPVQKLPELYHKADLFISAERNAGWSNTSAEAMACGIPVIASKSGTEDFLFHGKTGLSVWRHPWFIQRAIRKLYHDPPLREALAVAARESIQAFSWEKLSDNIELFLQEKLKAPE